MIAKFLSTFVWAQLVLASVSAHAGLLVPTSLAHQGSLENSLSNANLLINGVFPNEFAPWTDPTCIPWISQTGPTGVMFTFDYGINVSFDEILISVDNNDDYRIDYSTDNASYFQMVLIPGSSGEIGSGMDTLSSDSSHSEYDPLINFGFVTGRYLRIYAVSGDGFYSIGEFQAFTAVPEPSAALMVLTVGALSVFQRKRAALR